MNKDASFILSKPLSENKKQKTSTLMPPSLFDENMFERSD